MSDPRTDLPAPGAPNFNQRLREVIQTYLGRQGNPLDRGLTIRDLVDTGVLKLRSGFQLKPGAGISVPLEPGDGVVDTYEPDLTPPPTPGNMTVTASISHVMIEHEAPLYRQGHGHLRTRVYGKVVNTGDPLPTFADAAEISQFAGTIYAHPSNPATTWRLWIKWETVDGVLSVDPAGGTNGLEATTGQDVALLLKALEGEITESQLYTDLAAKINDSADGVSYLATQNGIRVQASSDGKTVIGGFGVMGSADAEKGPTIDFGVLANSFYIAAPATATGIDSAIPFIVQTTATTINGVEVPIGVYMRDAFIQNGTITNAKIANLAVDDAKIANVSVDKLTAGTINVGQYIRSSNHVWGQSGWVIDGNGNAEFGAASIRGQLSASQINTEGLTIKENDRVILGAGASLPAQFVSPDSGWLNSNLVPSINTAATTANWSNVSGAGKPADGATSGSNLVRKPTFADGSMGSWGAYSVAANDFNNYTSGNFLIFNVRDTFEVGNDFPVVPGEVLYVGASITTWQSQYTAGLGLAFFNSSGSIFDWQAGAVNPAMTGWNRRKGAVVVPAGAVKAVPWFQIDGPGGQSHPVVWGTEFYIGRAQEGATVGAPVGTYVGSIPAQNVESHSGAQLRADNAANWAVSAAQTYAAAQAALARTNADAYADGIVTAAEQRSIADATTKANAAKDAAIASASSSANLCFNADFSYGTAGWIITGNPFSANFGIQGAGATWAVNGGVGEGSGTASIHQNNATASGYFEVVSDPIPVEAGKRYCVSAYTGAHRANSDVFAYWANADGNYVGNMGADVEYNTEQMWGGQQLADYKRQQQFGVAPSNATSARVALRKFATKPGYSDSWLFVARVQFEQVGTLAASAGAWSAPGASAALRASIAAEASLAKVTAQAYADGKVTAEEQRAIADASAKAEAARVAAVNAAAQDASNKANAARTAAETYAAAQAEAARVTANAYADGKVTAEEQRAINDATAKAEAARVAAVNAAAQDASNKANAARNGAVSDVTPSINAKLSRAGDTISGRLNFAIPDGMFAGSDLNNGVYFGSDGLVGRKGGLNTFYINAAGDAVFAGELQAAKGTFSGSLNVASAATGARMEITNSVIKVFDAAGVLRVKLGDLT